MLNFLLQFLGKNRRNIQPVPIKEKQSSDVQAAKQEAMERAGLLPDDESAVVDFVLQCRFADARYVAAQKVHTVSGMERVKAAMLKTDRRVYRMMQARLNEKAHTETVLCQVRHCIDEASGLAADAALTPNRVADLDREWEAIPATDLANLPDPLKRKYAFLRSQLEERLSNQLLLQRKVRAARAELMEIGKNRTLEPGERTGLLTDFAIKLAEWKASPERLSLPRGLLPELETVLKTLQDTEEEYRREFDGVSERIRYLEEWEKLEASAVHRAEIERIWEKLPRVHDTKRMQELEERFSRFLSGAQTDVSDTAARDFEPERFSKETRLQFDRHLQGLAQAVASGAVQDAALHEEALRQPVFAKLELTEEQAEKLNRLRSETRRLKGWAKWSEELSREKLIRWVEELDSATGRVDELAATVVKAREEWKALNAVSGMASREQWIRFDTACNRAYEPVVEHMREQAEAKEKNVRHAEALIEKVRVFAEAFECASAKSLERGEPVNWKELINFYRQISKDWRQLGLVGRHEKKKLDEAFSTAIRPIRNRLYEQTQLEISKREKLIDEVGLIVPNQKEAGKRLRAIQQQWQTCAKAFPLDNREDKKLWDRFREACERLHAGRTEKYREADSERLQHLKQKEAVCAELETLATMEESSETERRLDELLNRWDNAGSVPREAEAVLQERLDAAVCACRESIRKLKQEEAGEALSVLCEKLTLCHRVEEQLASFCRDTEEAVTGSVFEDREYETAWGALPSLSHPIEAVLSHRFYTGLKAIAVRNLAYGKRLINNTSLLKENLLRFEILFGLDSPAFLKEERLEKQVEVLQETLGGGQQLTPEEVIRYLLEFPALPDEEDVERIKRLILKLKKPG